MSPVMILVVVVLAVLSVASAFTSSARAPAALRPLSAAAAVLEIKATECPDFYWQYRLDRLVAKKGEELPYASSNYKEVNGAKAQYDAYYLDLTLQGKLAGFDWMAEKEITDAEWLSIYKSICDWTQTTAKANKPSTSNLPSSDFDLLKQFYPQLNFRDLETPFVADEVGANFPYANMKEMLSAAMAKTLNVPGYSSSSVTSIEANEVRSALKSLETATMKKVDAIYEDSMKFAQNPFPDAEAKSHYTALKTKLAGFPQGAAAWATYRANMEKEVDEMARLASKKEDPHHHGHDEHDDGHAKAPTPKEEFQAKYGKSLDEMQERMIKYKANPEAFLEASIVEKFGKNGLDIWKKSQEFSANMQAMSDADKAAVEKKFADFVKSV